MKLFWWHYFMHHCHEHEHSFYFALAIFMAKVLEIMCLKFFSYTTTSVLQQLVWIYNYIQRYYVNFHTNFMIWREKNYLILILLQLKSRLKVTKTEIADMKNEQAKVREELAISLEELQRDLKLRYDTDELCSCEHPQYLAHHTCTQILHTSVHTQATHM